MASPELTLTAHDEAVELARELQCAYTRRLEAKLLIAIDALETIATMIDADNEHRKTTYQALKQIRNTK